MTIFKGAIVLALACLPLSLAAASAPLAAEAAPATTRIVLANFSFTPTDLQLAADEPVTLHFVNEGSGGHNFVAPEFFAAAAMDEATRKRLGRKGVVELAKGESLSVTLTPKAGIYKVKCTHFLHAGFGMTGTITVR
jgi:plastocyanin